MTIWQQLPGWATLFLAAAGLTVHAADATIPVAPVTPAGSGATVKVLFMGTDVGVWHQRSFRRVLTVEGSSFVLDVDGRRVRVPIEDRSLRFKLEPSLKLADASASVAKLKGERAYAPGSDPRRKYDSASGAAAGAAAVADLATAQVAFAQETYAIAVGAANAPGAQPGAVMAAEIAGARLADANAALGPALDQGRSEMNNPAAFVDRPQAEHAAENYDAMAVEFELSSEVPLARPHLVVLTRYRERGAPPGSEQSMIYARSLDPIDTRPRKIAVRQPGYPKGFELEEYRLHLYNDGVEVATNVSSRRVPLAADEAFQYLVMEHISANKQATLPAVPLVGQLPTDLRTRLTAEQFGRTYHLKVAKDGRALGAYLDKNAARAVEDAYLAAVLRRILFKPALTQGRPVESVCAIRLADLPP